MFRKARREVQLLHPIIITIIVIITVTAAYMDLILTICHGLL